MHHVLFQKQLSTCSCQRPKDLLKITTTKILVNSYIMPKNFSIGYKHPPKFCLSFVLEPPYQPFTTPCLALSSTQASVIFLQNDSLSIRSCCIPLTSCSFVLGPNVSWENPRRKFTILEGNQPSLQKLCNSIWQPTRLQNCTNLLVKPHWENCTIPPSRAAQPKNYEILGSSQHLCLEIVQISSAAIPSPSQKCTFFLSNWVGSCMCSWVDQFHPGPRKLELHAWANFSPNRKRKCKKHP